MKRLSIVAISLVASLVLVGCGSSSSDSSSKSSGSSTTTDKGNNTSTDSGSSTTTDGGSSSTDTSNTGDKTDSDKGSSSGDTSISNSLTVNDVKDLYGYKISSEAMYSASQKIKRTINFACDGSSAETVEYPFGPETENFTSITIENGEEIVWWKVTSSKDGNTTREGSGHLRLVNKNQIVVDKSTYESIGIVKSIQKVKDCKK